jgi:hypothetical protein
MAALLVVVTAVAVALHGMSAGIHVLGVVALNPSWRTLEPSTYVEVKQAADRRFPVLMRPLTLAGLVAPALAVGLAVASGAAAVAAAAGAALVAAGVGLVAVLRGDLPINQRMATWSAADPPADLAVERDRWERWFAVRTAATAVAACASIAALALASGQG